MAIAEQKKSMPIALALAGAAVVVLLILAVRALTRTTFAIRVGAVTRQTLRSTVSTNGKVEPVNAFQAHAPAPGVVEQIFVKVGDHVAPGQLLLQMDDTEAKARVATARANLTTAEASLTDIQQGGSAQERNHFTSSISSAKLAQQQAQTNLATVQKLQQQGAASAGEVAAAQQQLNTANLNLSSSSGQAQARYGSTDLTTAQSRVADARASLSAAESSYAGVAIRSPLAGTAYSIPVSRYNYVPAGDDLLEVADLNRIQIRAYFDEPEIGKLAAGQPVSITWEAKPGRVWHGHVERAPSTVVTYGTRSVGESLITVDDANGDLLPNTNVTVQVTELERDNVLSIPREALHTEGTRNFVFRVIKGKLAQTPIGVGVVTTTDVEVTGGIREGEVVALGASLNGTDLSNGQPVKTVQ